MLFLRKGVGFKPAPFAETREKIKNPGRGFYEIHTFVLGQPWDLENLRWCVKEEHSLALVLFDIRAARDREISPEELSAFDALLSAFEALDVDILLRIVYDREGKGILNEPQSLARITGHMRQLAPVIRAHSGRILLLQGLLVGSWGEMHTSRFLQPASVRQLAEVWLQETDCPFAVRTPGFMRVLERGERPVSLYNDGLFGSETDLGTYEDREADLKYLLERGRYCLNGGEAVCGESRPGAAEVVDRMRKLHIAYLNSAHDARMLEHFRALNYAGETLYDYIEAHMGYRFVVRRVVAGSIRGGGKNSEPAKGVHLEIRVENVGFGNLCQEAEVFLILEQLESETADHAKQRRELPLKADPRRWDPGEAVIVSADIIDPATARVYLTIRRKADGKVLQFSNQGQKEGRVILGTLGSPRSPG